MSTIILPSRWKRQPSGPVGIDRSNVITNGLSSALSGASGPYDLAKKASYALQSGVSSSATNKGIALSFNGSTDGLAGTGFVNTSSQWTMAAWVNFGSTSGFPTVWSTATAANAYASLLRLDNNSRLTVYQYDSDADRNASDPATVSSGVDYFVVAAWSGSVLYLYKNGALVASTSVATMRGTATTIRVGQDGTTNGKNAFTGTIPFTAYWDNRALSGIEVSELSENPWQIFRKKARILYFPSAGGGGATITGDSGSYTLTGTAATLKAGRKLAADSGTYNLTGTAAALKVGRKLTADSGTYTLTGTAVAFKRGYALGAESGTYTVSGTSVNLKAGRKLTADSGSYALTGTDVTLNYSPAGSYNLTAESGTYTLTGTAATLKVSRKLTADSGTYALTGTAAGLAKGVRLTAESGSYTLTGSNVAFARTYVLTAESGAYTLTGTSAGLTWSGAPVVEVPTNGGPSIYGKPVFREKQFRKEYEEQVKRIEDEKRLARILREDEEITVIMALMAA